MKNSCTNQASDSIEPPLPNAQQLIQALTAVDYASLLDFAAKRLNRLENNGVGQRCFSGVSPEDILHEALHRLLLGDSHPRHGRKLKEKNRRSSKAFRQFVFGVINSILSNTIRTAEFSVAHVPLVEAGEPKGVELPDPRDAAKRLEHRDLHRELFARLRQQAATNLHAVIDDWETGYLDDAPVTTSVHDRRQVYRLRLLARDILRSLADEGRRNPAGGMLI